MKGSPKISVKQVVAAVIRNLGIQDAAKEFHNFVEWSFEAEKKIGSYLTFDKKIATLTVTSKKVLLPEDFINTIEILSENGDYDAANCYSSGGYLNIDVSDNTIIKLHYEAISTDDDGYPTISAAHEDAIAAYIMYKYKGREYYNQKLPRYVYQDLKNEWSNLCAQARGKDNMPSKQQWRNIGKYWNSLQPTRDTTRKLF
jgi:hypothetical protein|tara:strand:+ start:10824 stop:11423 length:600 start_codon:yes stop_codon:yes gene_type:complete